MCKIIDGFTKFELKTQKTQKNMPEGKNHKSLKSNGFYNGDILNCTHYEIKGKTLIPQCEIRKFFDFHSGELAKQEKLQILNVNGIIEIEDSILLIERGENTYCYQGFLDFPAGLAVNNKLLIERLKERIQTETGLSPKNLSIKENPDFAEKKGDFFSLFYIMNTKLGKEEAKKILDKNSEENNFILLKKSEIKNALSSNKKIYPVLPLQKYMDI